jgi:DNA repair protein RecO (recombination protein O)
MSSEKTRGIIYQIIKYSEKSAICFAFTEDKGKLKFFVSNAFGKNKTILKLIPAELTFIYKHSTDLHKLLTVEYLTDYLFFQENPDLFLRLNLLFEILDNVLHDDRASRNLWKYIVRLNNDNYKKGILFIIYQLLLTSDLLYEKGCVVCGNMEEDNLLCSNCCSIFDGKNAEVLLDFFSYVRMKSAYKRLQLKDDSSIINFFVKIVNQNSGKTIKSYDFLRELLIL